MRFSDCYQPLCKYRLSGLVEACRSHVKENVLSLDGLRISDTLPHKQELIVGRVEWSTISERCIGKELMSLPSWPCTVLIMEANITPQSFPLGRKLPSITTNGAYLAVWKGFVLVHSRVSAKTSTNALNICRPETR